MRAAALDFDIDRLLNHIIPRPRLNRLPKSISWILGYHSTPPPRIGDVAVWWWAFIGAFCGILSVEAVFRSERLQAQGAPIVIASFVCPRFTMLLTMSY